MTLAELQELQRLLEKAQTHAEQQAAYTPNNEAGEIWRRVANDCIESLYSLHAAILIISEAMTYEP